MSIFPTCLLLAKKTNYFFTFSILQALELVGPAYRTMDSFVGVREKTCIIFVYGLLLMRQQNPQEAR